MKNYFIVTLVALVLSASVQSTEVSDFLTTVDTTGEKYQEIVNSNESLLLIKQGKKSEVNARLKNLVPYKDKTVYDYFLVSNLLYKADSSASKLFMERANALSPNNPYILYELAIHEHRSGNCKAALPLYEASATLLKKTNPTLWSYVTHCNLVLGNYLAAMDAWQKVDFRNHHTRIEKAMYEIFNTKNSDADREKHLSALYAGKADAACELIETDHLWEIDWWNVENNKQYLEHDIALVKSLSQNNKELKRFVDLCIDSAAFSDGAFRKFIAESGYWGKEYQLPNGAMASYFLIRELNRREIAKPAEIIEKYEQQLLNRHHEDPNDLRTLGLLAFLYNATENKEKLKPIDIHGWKNLGLEKYAESYISRVSDTEPEFKKSVELAAAQFPNSLKIQGTYLGLHQRLEQREKSLMMYVAAQFANVKDHMNGKFRLNDYMAALEHEMNNKVSLQRH